MCDERRELSGGLERNAKPEREMNEPLQGVRAMVQFDVMGDEELGRTFVEDVTDVFPKESTVSSAKYRVHVTLLAKMPR